MFYIFEASNMGLLVDVGGDEYSEYIEHTSSTVQQVTTCDF